MAEFTLTLHDLRIVAAYAAACAEDALPLFEKHCAIDTRPRDAIVAAWAFARGSERGKALRDHAFAAMRAGSEASHPVAAAAGRAAMFAASAAYLHPLAQASQVGHILGAAASAALAVDLEGDGVDACLTGAVNRASPELVGILRRYPAAPAGGGKAGALMRRLDDMLRQCDQQ